MIKFISVLEHVFEALGLLCVIILFAFLFIGAALQSGNVLLIVGFITVFTLFACLPVYMAWFNIKDELSV